MELRGSVEPSPSLVITLRAAETSVVVTSSGDDQGVVEPVQSIQHSSWQQQPPKCLQYSGLGKLLISVVQKLFHSLADAYGEAFTFPVSDTSVEYVPMSMMSSMHWNCMVLRGEGITQVIDYC